MVTSEESHNCLIIYILFESTHFPEETTPQESTTHIVSYHMAIDVCHQQQQKHNQSDKRFHIYFRMAG